jgi:hypothetical protein
MDIKNKLLSIEEKYNGLDLVQTCPYSYEFYPLRGSRWNYRHFLQSF